MKIVADNLRTLEKTIIKKLEEKESAAIEAFKLTYLYFYIYDMQKNSNHLVLLKKIYLEKQNVAKWKLANECYVGQRSIFRYRRGYAEVFFNCYEALPDIMKTLDKLK